jgi:hypothetical protein
MLRWWLCSSSAPGVSLLFGFEKRLGDDREKLLSPLLYSNRALSQKLLSEGCLLTELIHQNAERDCLKSGRSAVSAVHFVARKTRTGLLWLRFVPQ